MPRTRRPLTVAILLYALVTFACFLTTAPERFGGHTPYNHFALLAEAWLRGRLDLGGPPPAYTGYNDFASFQDRWFISFPPFPAVLIAPVVKLFGGAAAVRDGLFFVLFTGVGPSLPRIRLRGWRGWAVDVIADLPPGGAVTSARVACVV